jgi:hypothetical protein
VTWVEIILLAGAIGLLVGVVLRRHRWARALALVSLCVVVFMLVLFGSEIVADLI